MRAAIGADYRRSLFTDGEGAMLPPLIDWLRSTGRVRARTAVTTELPWLGRRVDLAVVTGRGRTSAFELKVGRFDRVLEQAAYNRLSFHTSWIVTANHPKLRGLDAARNLGLGLVVVKDHKVTPMLLPREGQPPPETTRRLQSLIRARA